MKTTILALVALVATIGIVFGAPMQLSGDMGRNISVNLTDDNAFMDELTVTTSTVYVVDTDELSQFVLDSNGGNTTMNHTKF